MAGMFAASWTVSLPAVEVDRQPNLAGLKAPVTSSLREVS